MVLGPSQSCRAAILPRAGLLVPSSKIERHKTHTLEEFFALLGSTHDLILWEDFENFANLFFVQLPALIKVFSQRGGNQKVVHLDAEFL